MAMKMIKYTFDQDKPVHDIFEQYAKIHDLKTSQVYRQRTKIIAEHLLEEMKNEIN